VRWLVRLPIWVFRARLGGLFGGRLLMLEHVGRRSGRARHVVLEVVDAPAPHRFVVVSGFGSAAQWLKNVQAHPSVRLWIKSHEPVAATASMLTSEQASEALGAYRRAHPRAWRALRPVLEGTLGVPIDEERPMLPMVALDASAARHTPLES
jgi:deazaflavin-dependent oxidoreductase (nitroreductase family)